MSDFSQMHVFFFISSIAAIVLSVLLAIVIIYVIKILNDIRYISGKAKQEADLITEDLSDLHDNVRKGGIKFKYFASFLNNVYKNHKK